MLEELDHIDWDSLETNFGSGGEIPNLIRDFMSDDAEVRVDASNELRELIAHQGTITDATEQTVPFLIELLESNQVRGKNYILALLWIISSTWFYLVRHQLTQQRSRGSISVEFRDEENAYIAVRQGVQTYITLLDDDDLETRKEAADLLSRFPEDAFTIIPELLGRIDSVQDRDIKAYYIWTLGQLAAEKPGADKQELSDTKQLLQSLAESEHDEYLRDVAIIALLFASEDEVHDRLIEQLIESVQQLDTDYMLPGENAFYPSVCEALCKLNIERGTLALVSLLEHTSTASRVHDVTRALLGFVFNSEVFPDNLSATYRFIPDQKNEIVYERHDETQIDIQKYSPHQLLTLEEILNNEKYWEICSNLLAMYGLPETREELKLLLRGES